MRKRKRITLSDRGFAFVIDIALTLILFLVVDLAGHPLANKIFDYEAQQKQYIQYQIDYNLGYLNANNEMVYYDESDNVNIRFEEYINDERVVALADTMEKEQFCQYGFDLVIAEIVVFLVLPLILKKGQTLGLKIMAKQVVDKENQIASNKIMFIRFFFGFLIIESLIPMAALFLSEYGIILALAIWVASGVYMLFNKEHKSIIDVMSKSKVIDVNKKEE